MKYGIWGQRKDGSTNGWWVNLSVGNEERIRFLLKDGYLAELNPDNTYEVRPYPENQS